MTDEKFKELQTLVMETQRSPRDRKLMLAIVGELRVAVDRVHACEEIIRGTHGKKSPGRPKKSEQEDEAKE